MFKAPKKPDPAAGTGMARRETALWLGRSLSSSQVVLQVMLQMIHVIGVQQQAIQALTRRQQGLDLGQEQQEALDLTLAAEENDLLRRLNELEADLLPVLKAVEQACVTLEKEIR